MTLSLFSVASCTESILNSSFSSRTSLAFILLGLSVIAEDPMRNPYTSGRSFSLLGGVPEVSLKPVAVVGTLEMFPPIIFLEASLI